VSVDIVFSSESRSVVGFTGAELPITIYPNAHGGDSISVLWSMSTEQAEQLAADIIAAVKAVLEAQAKPAEDCFCAADHGPEVR
jgi:2-polyprenyl-6-methoxyphenol hydroxylase-like FAD-dependent oxidoreductase